MLLTPVRSCCGAYSIENARIRATAADIAFQRSEDLLIGGMRALVQQSYGGKNHARCAVSALKRFRFEKRFLDRMKLPVPLQAFYGGNLLPNRLRHRRQAGTCRRAVNQNRARPALSFATTVLRSCQAHLVPQDVKEFLVGRDIHMMLPAVDP